MTPEIRQQIAARAEAALKVIEKLAETGGESFRMSIPAEANDTDLLLGTVCDDVSALLSALQDAEARAEAAEGRFAENQVENVWNAGARAALDRAVQLYRQKARDAASKPGRTVKDYWDRVAVPMELNALADEIVGLELPAYLGGDGAGEG